MPPPRENKLKAFFRPRSRSRSHPHPMPSPPTDNNPPSSFFRSSVRSQNRPISSTTTATHSTITPLPSDALRNRSRQPYPLHTTDTRTSLHDHDQYADTYDHDSDDHRLPRSETPSSTRRKLLWHSFFGIVLSRGSSSSISIPAPHRKASTSTSASDPKSNSPRKRSFRFSSRPATPKSLDDSSPSKSPPSIPIPSSPLPLSASPRRRSFGLGTSQRTTPKSSASHLPLPHLQTSQVPRSHGRRHSVGSERPPHDSAVALPEEPSHRSAHKPPHDGPSRNKGKEREKTHPDSERPLQDLPSPFHPPFQSLPSDLSPISRHHLFPHFAAHPAFPVLPTVDSASSEENDHPSHRLHVIPQIIHTPPTPQRPGGEVGLPLKPSTTSPAVGSGIIEASKGKTVATVHREQVLVSSSQSYTDVHHTRPSKGRFTPRFLAAKNMSKTKNSDVLKSSRRPPASSCDGPPHKTPGPTRNITSHRGKLGSFDFERPVSALNRSNSTVDRQKMYLPQDNPSRLHSLERTLSSDSTRGGKSSLVAHHPKQAESPTPQLKPDHTGDTSVISFSSVSLQTKSTGIDNGVNAPAGQSSSWGRASGRRVLRTSHGTFAFEHPSSVPSSPNPHTFNLANEPYQNGPPEHLPRSQPTTPSQAIFDPQVTHSRVQSHSTSDHVEPGRSVPGERKPKGKGRSLDLGLGLSWAPSRLREEILMPGLILAREKAKLEKDRTNGSDVTKTFESLLSESRFQTFKKYVRRFDAHIIPLDGPSGLLARVEKLLSESGLGEQETNKLMSEFAVFVESHGG